MSRFSLATVNVPANSVSWEGELEWEADLIFPRAPTLVFYGPPKILSQSNSQTSTKQKENKVLSTKMDYLGPKYHEQYLPVHMHMKKEIMTALLLMGIIW